MSGTYISKIPVLVVALVIGIVLVTSAVVPLASDYSEAKTFKNDGLYYMSVYDNTKSIELYWDHTKPAEINLDDDVVTLSPGSTFPYTIMCTEDFIVRFTFTSSSNASIQIWAESWGSSQYQASIYNNQDMTITVEAGTITCDNGSGTTKTYSYTTDLYMISTSGDHVMKAATEKAYVKSDSTTIVASGRSSVGGSINFWITGTIDDGFTIGNTYGDNISPSFSDITYTDNEVAGYIDLYQFEKLMFTATTSGTDYDVTYSQVIVPAEVSADPDNPVAYKNLVKVVPLMAFIMLVVAAAGMVYFKNKD